MKLDRVIEHNLMAAFVNATEAEREFGLHFFENAQRDAKNMSERYGITLEQAAGVIAALSPGLDYGLSLLHAESFIAGIQCQQLRNVGLYGSRNRIKALEILLGKDPLQALPPSGPRVRKLYKCIVDPFNCYEVPTGRHARGLAEASPKDPATTEGIRVPESNVLEAHYQVIAKRLGIMPHQLQAVTKTVWNRLREETAG